MLTTIYNAKVVSAQSASEKFLLELSLSDFLR